MLLTQRISAQPNIPPSLAPSPILAGRDRAIFGGLAMNTPVVSDHRRPDRHRPRHRTRLRPGRRPPRRLRPPRGRSARRSSPSLRGLGAEAAFIRADVRHDDDVRDLVDQTVARFGRLDVAVNNAGTEGKPGPVTDQTRRELCRDLRHQRARHAAQHEARAAGHAGARAPAASSTSRRPMGTSGARGACALRREQARGRRPDQVGRARGRRVRRARQRRRAGTDRDRDARPLHRHAGARRPALVAGVPLERVGAAR